MKITNRDNKIIFCFKSHKFLLINTLEYVWRIISEKDGKFDFTGAAQTLSKDLGENCETPVLPVNADENSGKITAEDGSYVIISDRTVSFFRSDGTLVRKIDDVRNTKDGVCISLSLSKKERLYGTGERFNRINQRGKRIHIYGIDRWCWKEGNSYIPIPVIFSSQCNALFFNRYEHSVFDLGLTSRNHIKVTQKNAPIDMYVFTHDSPEKILTAYCSITGFAPVPPQWAFGTLVCRYHPEFGTPEGILNMTKAMEENGFPWEAVITEGWSTYNLDRWEDLKKVSEAVHSMGKKMMVYEQCGRFPKFAPQLGLDDSHAVNSDKGYYLKETRSINLLDNFHRKKMRCVDLTDKNAVGKWEEVWDRLLNFVGVDGAKIDFCEQFPDDEGIIFSDKRNPKSAHHWYPTYYNILRYKHFNTRPDGGMNFSRGGGIGLQRAPFVWAGDQRREFNFLGAVIKASLSLGFSGVPFVSWDMAGYRPSFLLFDKIKEANVFMRAVEFTAFSPTVQTHGSVKRPYDFDEHTRAVYRAYTTLHDVIRPYIIQQAEITSETGLPMMRHLFMQFYNDENVFDTEDEYMFGDSLLVAPVLNNSKHRNIYLPDGEWVNIFTGEKFSGGQTLKSYKVPIEAVPVFRNIKINNSVLDEALKNAKKYTDEILNLSK